MRKMKKVFAALLLLFVTNTLMAQSETYTLKGSLKDANDGAMMPYTNCVLLHSTDSVFAYGVTSDDKGAFYLSEQRAYWLESIERDMRNMDQPKKYVSLEQFGQELMAAVKSKVKSYTVHHNEQNPK